MAEYCTTQPDGMPEMAWETVLGRVSGFVSSGPGEPVVYWAGDTILYDEIKTILTSVKPDIIITYSAEPSSVTAAHCQRMHDRSPNV